MTGIAQFLDIGAMLAGAVAFDPVAVVAGGGADGAEIDGVAIDRFTVESLDSPTVTDARRRGLSAALFVGVRTTLAAAETITVIANAQDADNAAFTINAADFDHRASAQPPDILLPTLLIGPGVLTDARDSLKQQYDLTGARQFLRSQVTPTMSAGVTDTADVFGFWVFSGSQHNRFEGELVGSSAVV